MGYTFDKLSEGDVRVEAKNDTVITSKGKLLITAKEVLINGETISTPPTINLLDNDLIQYNVVLNEKTNQLDIHTDFKAREVAYFIRIQGGGGVEFENG